MVRSRACWCSLAALMHQMRPPRAEKLMATCSNSEEGEVLLWSLVASEGVQPFTIVRRFGGFHSWSIMHSAAFSLDGRFLVVANHSDTHRSGELRVFDVDSG